MASDGIVVGLDIGTTKVCAIIGEQNEAGMLEITGVGLCPSTGLKKGVVVNIEATLQSVAQAIEAAEMMSGREVHSCWTGIGGSHIEGTNSRGVVAVTGRNRETREIGLEDIERVLEAARAMVIPLDKQILEVIPQSFIVDNQKGISNPLNMIGVRLEVDVHIITCSVTIAQNLIKCVHRAGFRVDDLVLQSLASCRSVLTKEEKEMGTLLIDMGGGTTDMLVYLDGTPYSISTIQAGGMQVTSDLSIIKNISFETAERVKLEAGCCWDEILEDDDDIVVPGVGGRPPLPIPRSHIAAIIQPRVEEIFLMVKERLDRLSLSKPLGGGVVLTGGASLLLGAAELASAVFDLPVRVGSPLPMNGLVEEYRSPLYATAVGLVLEGDDRGVQKSKKTGEAHTREKKKEPIFKKLAEWLGKEFF